LFIKALYNSNFLKRFLPAVLLITLCMSFGCRKVKEELELRFLMDAMTNGRWVVNIYTREGADETSAFKGYEFQFTSDNKVYAIKSGTEIKGTWSANLTARTIESNFPVTTTPLVWLNDNFLVTNNTPKLVEAHPLDEAKNIYLKLVKKAN